MGTAQLLQKTKSYLLTWWKWTSSPLVFLRPTWLIITALCNKRTENKLAGNKCLFSQSNCGCKSVTTSLPLRHINDLSTSNSLVPLPVSLHLSLLTLSSQSDLFQVRPVTVHACKTTCWLIINIQYLNTPCPDTFCSQCWIYVSTNHMSQNSAQQETAITTDIKSDILEYVFKQSVWTELQKIQCLHASNFL